MREYSGAEERLPVFVRPLFPLPWVFPDLELAACSQGLVPFLS